MKNPYTPRLLATAALILAASGLAACGKGGAGKAEQESTADAPVPVEAFAVARQPIIANYTGTASLEAEREVLSAVLVGYVLGAACGAALGSAGPGLLWLSALATAVLVVGQWAAQD